jgi:hypothetical protein
LAQENPIVEYVPLGPFRVGHNTTPHDPIGAVARLREKDSEGLSMK